MPDAVDQHWVLHDTDRSDVSTIREFCPCGTGRVVAYEVLNDDAFLIEAAPELYQLVKDFVRAGTSYTEPDDWSPDSVDFDRIISDARRLLAKADGSEDGRIALARRGIVCT